MWNLLEETKMVLAKNNLSLSDIVWAGNKNVEVYSDIGLENLLNFEYDRGYGSQEVLEDLILVGKDFWLERHDYDGSEWWEFKTMPSRPKKKVNFGLRNFNAYSENTIDEILLTKDFY